MGGGGGGVILPCVPIFYINMSVVVYRIFINVPILKDFPPICPHFLGVRDGRYELLR